MAKSYNPGKWERGVQGAPTLLSNPASHARNQFFGVTQISSAADNLRLIGATCVQSNSIIFTQLQRTATQSEAVPVLCVTSILPSSGFYLSTTASWALLNSYYVHWEVKVRA